MKRIYILIIAIVFGSCTDLTVFPTNSDLAPGIFTNAIAYKSYLAKIYGAFSHTGQQGPAGQADISIVTDEGFTSYIRAYWKAQELTTDEAVIAWSDAGIRNLHEHTWNSDNQFVRVIYYRIFLIIAYANDFLYQSSDEVLDTYGVPAEDRAEIKEFENEVRFLRAMAYWHALDLFRNIPLLTSATTELPVQVAPTVIFDFIESELEAIEPLMPEPRQNEYGRADVAAVWMLQAKLFLNASVYVSQDRYSDVVTATEKVINAGYTLNSDYKTLFMADNHTSNELIWTLPADGKQAQNWGNTTFLVHAAIGGEMVDSDYGVTGPWEGLRTTKTMVEKFSTNGVITDPRGIFYTQGQSLEINSIDEFTDGYAVPKFTNITSGGQPGSDVTFVDTDYPMFRLADAYLMHAEALLRGGQGDLTIDDAVSNINLLRERAYGNTNANIVNADLTLDFILDERVRELYWEGSRRVDLIRFGQYTDAGIWPWKGNVKEGALTESWRSIFPIPASDLIANPKLEQNDGY